MRPRTASLLVLAAVIGAACKVEEEKKPEPPPPEPDGPFSKTITVGDAVSRFLVGETFPAKVPGFEGAKLVVTAIDRQAGTITFGAVAPGHHRVIEVNREPPAPPPGCHRLIEEPTDPRARRS